MWPLLIKSRLKRHDARSAPVATGQVAQAASVLFAVFARYGDSIIAFKCIREFMRRYPDKRYLLITTHQARPYAEELLPAGMEQYSVNKRHDLLQMWRLTRRLRGMTPDIGFNPWSHGTESEYFLTFCRRFVFYRHYDRFTKVDNLYARVRGYLGLPEPGDCRQPSVSAGVRRVLISPFSTDVRKELGATDLETLLTELRIRFPGAELTVALPPAMRAQVARLGVQTFVFGKSEGMSRKFIGLLRTADLVVSVDAGPLHIADALGVASIGLFGPTAPETILDGDSRVLPVRDESLNGIFCDVMACRDPVCIHRRIAARDLLRPVAVDFGSPLTLETEVCRADSAHIPNTSGSR